MVGLRTRTRVNDKVLFTDNVRVVGRLNDEAKVEGVTRLFKLRATFCDLLGIYQRVMINYKIMISIWDVSETLETLSVLF